MTVNHALSHNYNFFLKDSVHNKKKMLVRQIEVLVSLVSKKVGYLIRIDILYPPSKNLETNLGNGLFAARK